MPTRLPPDPATAVAPAPPTPPAAPLRVLVVDDGAGRGATIRAALAQRGHEVVGVVDAARVVHDSVVALAPDVVIVDADSPSRDTLEHLAAMSEIHPRPVVVFAEDDADAPMRRAVAAGVSAYVVAGLEPRRLDSVLRVAIARFERERALRARLDAAEQRLADRRDVERAKALLMRRRGLSEPDAHARLRRAAMDRGLRLPDLARRMLDAADLLG